MGSSRGLAHTRAYRGRGYRLLVGTLCLVVVISVAICAVIGFSIISNSTRQTEEALESAITAYGRYLQEIGGDPAWGEELASMNSDGLLDEMVLDPTEEDIRELSRRLVDIEVPYRSSNPDACFYVYFPGQDLMVGSEGQGVDPRTYDARISQIDESLFAQEDETPNFMVEVDGKINRAELGTIAPGVRYLLFFDMPDLPDPEILTPISGVCEIYFADRYGHKYSYAQDPRFIDVFTFDQLEGSGESGLVDVIYDGATYKCFYHDNCPGYNKFVLVAGDVVADAQRSFVFQMACAAGLLILGGCVAGLLLTRHIYEPLQRIINRLTPAGHDVSDEFKLIGSSLSAMEQRIDEQRGRISDYRLMRLLRDPSERALAQASAEWVTDAASASAVSRMRASSDANAGADEGDAPRDSVRPFFLVRDCACALAIVRGDSAVSPPELRGLIGGYLGACEGRRDFTLCQESDLAFVVLDATAADVRDLMDGLRRFLLDEHGLLVSVFVSDAYRGPTMLNASYREAVRIMEQASAEGVFNKTVGSECLRSSDSRSRSTLDGSGLFDDMCAFVRGNYCDPNLSAGLVAKRFGVGQASVTRLFKQHTEGGFLDYLHALRLDEAETLLGSTDLSVAEVARRVGYGDVSTMSRAFRRYRDKTPGECRASS